MLFEEESRTYNIFISHIGKQEEEYSIFIQKLSSASDFRYNNLGILDKINQNELQEQIKPAEIVIILSGLYNKYKSIIKKQMDIARKLDKPIIVIRPYGMENVPLELEEVAADVIGWNTPCIVDSIEENYLE
ncbi:MAG: TIR domain-containing protein [Methanobacterium sp.]